MSLVTLSNEQILLSADTAGNVVEFARHLFESNRNLIMKCDELRDEIAALKEEIRAIKAQPGGKEDVAACLRVIQLLGGNRPNEEGND